MNKTNSDRAVRGRDSSQLECDEIGKAPPCRSLPASKTTEALSAQAIKDRVNREIDHELADCRSQMGEDAWREHGEWVTDYVVTEVKISLRQQLQEGEL